MMRMKVKEVSIKEMDEKTSIRPKEKDRKIAKKENSIISKIKTNHSVGD